MENEILQKSIQPDLFDPPFTNREYVYVNDKSGSNYSNDELQYDLTGLANSGNFPDFPNGYIVLPVVACISDDKATLIDKANDFCLGLKNGFHHLLNRITLTISNKQVIEATDFLNLPIHFKLITQMSENAMEVMGDSMGMYLDETTGIKYIKNSVANEIGFGECNNEINDVYFDAQEGYSQSSMSVNKGFRRRMKNTNYSLHNQNALHSFNTNDALNLSLKNYSIQSSTRGAMCFYIVATIRLGDIHDLFNKMPLVQGLSAVLKVYTNMPCSFTIEHDNTPVYSAGKSLSANLQARASGVIPFMIPPIGRGLYLSGVAGLLTTSMALVKVIDPRQTGFNFPLHPLQSTRVYIPMLTMSIPNASKYFSSVSSSGLPIKEVEYDEVVYYPLSNVAIGRFDRFLMLTNSVHRIRALLIVPVVSKSVNGGGDTNTPNAFGISPLSSPFSSACGTSTNAIITNYNVQLSGKAVYASNVDYGFEMFQQEVSQYYSLGGNIDRQMTSGLISQSNYENGYRYLFTNLSRKNKDYDNIGQSVNIRGVNSSNCVLDFHCFIFYEKSIKINVADGTLIE